MKHDDTEDRHSLPKNPQSTTPTACEERDAAIERLERTIAEERQASAKLHDTVDDLHFKAEVLEKSYSKQLEDARLHGEAVERELADQKARLVALDSAREDALRLLTEARAELERVTADRDQLRSRLRSTDGVHTVVQEDAESRPQDDPLTIDELMEDSSRLSHRQAIGRGNEHPEAQAHADLESPFEEMISPESVFPDEGADEDEAKRTVRLERPVC